MYDAMLSYLQRDLELRCKKNARYSLRAYARFLEIEPSALSKIMKGKRSISESMHRHFSVKLGLTKPPVKVPVRNIEELKQKLELFSRDAKEVLENPLYEYSLTISLGPVIQDPNKPKS